MANQQQNQTSSYTFTAKLISLDEPRNNAKNYTLGIKIVGDAPEGSGYGKGIIKVLMDPKVWDVATITKQAEEESEGEITVEKVTKEGGDHFTVLSSWGGVTKPPYEAGGNKGGGGGKSYTPRGPEEIHSSAVCGIIKSAIDAAAATGETKGAGTLIDLGLEKYFAAMDKVKERAK